ncbi:Kinase, NEK [Giardia lamblia P15]|uniref:Kinase, NEK n=1 Tax=Giardia intestinalis (strain P15) TaxID=658858 RepID=E1EZC0_GIAIA|nr:Kinase, NEK [Giardia lamblia P15]
MRADSSEPATEAPIVPGFTSKELHERFDDELGKGMTGMVYSLKGYPGLAVKAIQLSGLSTISVDALKLELATVPGLSHPGIIKYHQVVWDEGLVYIVMDRRDKTLESLISEYKQKRIPIPIELVLSAVRQIAAALAYFHTVNDADAGRPVRCDLRPANVLVSEDGEHFVIADFGLCKDALRNGSTLAGTRPYMAPETLVHKKTSPASDMWSLGVILYELATLNRPDFLEGREPAEVFVNGWKPDLSDVTDDFIRYILGKIFVLDPAERLTASGLSELLRASDASPRELMVLISVLSDKCESLETALITKIGALEEALTRTSSRNEALEKTVATPRGDFEAKSTKMAAFEKELASKTEEIASLRKDLEAKTAKIGTLEKTISTQATNVDGLTKDLEAKAARITTLEGQCREHLAATKALEAKVMQLSDATPQSELLLLPKLIRAAHMNSTETVRTLLEEGVRAGQRDTQGMTALMHAARQGHTGPVELLVEREKGLQDKNGWTALMHAAYNNRPEVVEILAPHEHGKRNNNNQTALMMAVENGNAEIASLLAPHEKGLKNSRDRTALMVAAEKGSPELVEALVEHEKGLKDKWDHNALYYALKNGYPGIAKTVIPHEDPTDTDGITALMRAAIRGDTEMVGLLIPLQKGLKDKDGNTAHMHALKNKQTDIAALLREHEASSWTPLMCASFAGDIEEVNKHLSDKDKKNSDGDTALIIAARAGHKDIVELLDPTDENGFTALMRAAHRNDPAAAEALLPLQGGMRTTRWVEIDGWRIFPKGTALMVAAARGHTEVARLLVEKEGGMSNKDGWTALMRAALKGRGEFTK